MKLEIKKLIILLSLIGFYLIIFKVFIYNDLKKLFILNNTLKEKTEILKTKENDLKIFEENAKLVNGQININNKFLNRNDFLKSIFSLNEEINYNNLTKNSFSIIKKENIKKTNSIKNEIFLVKINIKTEGNYINTLQFFNSILKNEFFYYIESFDIYPTINKKINFDTIINLVLIEDIIEINFANLDFIDINYIDIFNYEGEK